MVAPLHEEPATGPVDGRAIAFFDVDETLIAVKSMFRFLRFYLAGLGRPPVEYASLRDELLARGRAGASRAELTREYYRVYAGHQVAEVAAWGRAWFAAEQRAGTFFLPAALAAFQAHRRRGDLTVLVSGSFSACLDPIARGLAAGAVIGARLEVAGGRYTGELVVPMIGPDKAAAVRAATRRYGVAAADCHAYGDDASDVPFLEAVGHPVVVGDDPALAALAAERDWPRLPGVPRGEPQPQPVPEPEPDGGARPRAGA
ncbi:MAG TPA: HAD-IB family hydrolase [Streptosporangiaceae bacterium]